MIGFAIDVDTRELTRVLKRLSKTEKTASIAYLRYVTGILTISMGATSDELPASGSWPKIISVTSKWVNTLAGKPLRAAVTDLRVHDGKLWARDFGVACSVVSSIEEGVAGKTGRAKTRRTQP